MLHGMPPFQAQSLNDIKDEFVRKSINVKKNLDPDIKDLLKRMLES